MKKFKRLMALMAVGMLSVQVLGAGTAFATGNTDCDFGSSDLEITLDDDDVDLWIENNKLYCDEVNSGGSFNSGGLTTAGDDFMPISSIDSITVEMDDDDSDGELFLGLKEEGTVGGAAEWPEFETFDIDVTSTLNVKGDGLGSASRDAAKVVAGAKTLSFGGTTATYSAPDLAIKTGGANDIIDASKATVVIVADGGNGNNVIKGGSRNDALDGGNGRNIIYGGAGNDDIDCDSGSTEKGDQGWGGDGLDDFDDCYTVAPGAGDDTIDSSAKVISYADLTGGIEYSYDDDLDSYVTGGDAGEDSFAADPLVVVGSQGDDVVFDLGAGLAEFYGLGGDDAVKVSSVKAYVEGGAGNDLIVALDVYWDPTLDSGNGDYASATTENVFLGQGGDDVLRGKGDNDELYGGPGKDQAWGGGGKDTCGAEVLNRCEYLKKNSV